MGPNHDPTDQVVCLTIVAEAVLAQRLLDDLSLAGVRGWTLTRAEGSGPRGRRVNESEGGNVRIEVLATSDVTDRVWAALHERYFPHYAVIAWQHSVDVSRPDLFGAS